MNGLAALIARLGRQGVTLSASDGQLHVRAPRGRLNEELRAELALHKAELIEMLEREPAIERVPREGRLALSHAQRRLWFLDRLEPGSVTFNIPIALRIEGSLDVSALDRALSSLALRHEVLRSTFPSADGRPRVHVSDHSTVVLERRSIADAGASSPIAAALEIAQREAKRPFDLATGPLLRATLVRLAADDHVLVCVVHHIVSDAWSTSIMAAELAELYGAAVRGDPATPSPLPIDYVDVAAWRERTLQGAELERLVAFWRKELGGAPAALPLPIDRRRPPQPARRGAIVQRRLGESLRAALRAFGTGEEATLFMTLFAAWSALIHRYTGEEDIVVGTPVSGRTRRELEGIIGLFVNMVPVRADLTGDPSFRELVGRIKERSLGAIAHGELPFERLVELLSPGRDASRSPVFQVAFVLQNTPRASFDVSGLRLTPFEVETGTAQLDLGLTAVEDADGIRCSFEYAVDLFESSTIERMAGHFETLLVAALASPDTPVTRLPLMTADERRAVLLASAPEWGERPAGALIHERFEKIVATSPTAVAVVHEAERVTYAELDARANVLAAHLVALGVGCDSRVALLLPRSIELIVGLIAILKAGGGYVPLDPDHPPTRLQRTLNDARPALLVTNSELAVLVGSTLPTVRVDHDRVIIAEHSPAAPPRTANPSSLAYLLYTSGSTGLPKGTAVTHANVERLFDAASSVFDFGADDVWPVCHSIAFDFSVWEIWGALASGGRLVIVPRETLRAVDALWELVVREGVTVLNQTPSAFYALARVALPSHAPRLRWIILGGEALDVDALGPWFARCSDEAPKLVNMYGITETTVHVTWHRVREQARSRLPARESAIGRALPDLGAYVLDRHRQVLPFGVPGEIYVGGAGVARGYFDRPTLDAERFSDNPFGPGRLYRSGDRARRRAPGSGVSELWYGGRLDDQVKIRGHRVELGEVEVVLAEHPGVDQAVVVLRDEPPFGQRLVAYLVANAGSTFPTHAELRAFGKARLPEPMRPTAFVRLDTFPLTPNGKLDRAALAPPIVEGPTLELADPAARTAHERAIASTWASLLGVPRVGLHDNFFDLGGHSLLLVEVQSQLEKVLGRTVPLVVLFQHPTVAALATFLSQGAPDRAAARRGRERGVDRRQHGSIDDSSIAVIGMALRFPGASDQDTFWRNLSRSVESIRFLSDAELVAGGVAPALFRDPRYVRVSSAPDDVDLFAASFFGYSPREAEVLDPQQRLFLECAWHALEDAAYDTERYEGRIGLFAGAGISRYLLFNLADQDIVRRVGELALLVANDKDYLATRVAYKLNLRGPAMSVQTACSTSLVAVHQAVRSLLAGESDIALAGGVSLETRRGVGYLHTEGSIASPDGHCRAFDASAAGTVGGSGAGVVVLKRLADAYRDGDRIVAVIRATAVNNDGAGKVGFTAPSVDGQAAVIAEAIAAAGISARDVGYVEAHGTGTALGDPIEVAALTQAFRVDTDDVGFCALGSVKTNIGHLDAAAGVAGLIKASLALERGEIPASLHFETPNPAIPFASSPFRVTTTSTPWPSTGRPRRAGVSSFGLGGTNAHVILEEAPVASPRKQKEGETPEESRPRLLLLSGRTEADVDAVAERLVQHLERVPLRLDDVAYTLDVGRRPFPHRRFVVCSDITAARAALARRDPSRTRSADRSRPRVVFVFDEVEANVEEAITRWRSTFEREPAFREAVERCAIALGARGFDPARVVALFDSGSPPAMPAEIVSFVCGMASAALWRARGVVPSAVVGVGAGEVLAAHVAGASTLEEVVAAIGRVPRREANVGELPLALASVAGNGREAVAAVASEGDHLVRLGLEHALERVQANGTTTQLVPDEVPESGDEWAVGLEIAGHLWLAGVSVAAVPRARRVALPGYPFDRQRYWIESSRREGRSSEEPRRWLHVPVWRRATSSEVAGRRSRVASHPPWIVFCDDVGLGEGLISATRESGTPPIVVRAGRQFEKVGDTSYVVAAKDPRSLDTLFAALGDAVQGRRLVYLWPVTRELPEPQHGLDVGFFALLAMLQAWSRLSRRLSPLDLVVVSTHLDDVLGNEKVSPEKSTLVGLCRSIPFELRGATTRVVDVALPTSDRTDASSFVASLLDEISNGLDEHVALRGSVRFQRGFAPLDWPGVAGEQRGDQARLRPGGAYLVTGGLGGIGLTIAEHLARTVQAKLVLVGRSPSPTAAVRRRLQIIEALGSEVLLASADLGGEEAIEEMRSIKERVNATWGPIHGVVHAAGIAGGGFFGRRTAEEARRVFGPKVLGTRAVLSMFDEGPPPDFVLLCSALSGVLGGLAQVDYAAANTALDAFAWSHARTGRFPVVSVDWMEWSGIGMAERAESSGVVAKAQRRFAMTPADGLDVFALALSANVPQILVARDPPSELLALARQYHSVVDAGAVATQQRTGRHARPELSVPYTPSRDELERTIASVWEDTLGLAPVGIHDEFFALGGDSLMAVTLAAELEGKLGIPVPITELLDGTTIERLAMALRDRSAPPSRSVAFREGPATAAPLVLLHAVAGTVACYRALAENLSVGRAVIGLGADALDGGVPITGIPELAAEHVRTLRSVRPAGPYVLAGWSMGALLAHEMAHQLVGAGQTVSGVIVIDMGAPALVNALLADASDHASLVARFAEDVAGIFGATIQSDRDGLGVLPESEQFTQALFRLRSSGALPSSMGDEMLTRLFGVFRANVVATRRYEASRGTWPVTLLQGEEGMLSDCPDPTWGWSTLFPDGVLKVRTVPGDHYALLRGANAVRLASEIDRVLEQLF